MANHTESINVPSWLNKDFFIEVIQNFEKLEEIVFQEFKLLPASAKNDQYASEIHRAVVKYSLNGDIKERSLIIKIMPEIDGEKKEFLKNTQIFESEIDMYTRVIPKFEKILSDAGDYTRFGPKCLYHSLSPKKVIIFEDMIPHGFKVLSKRQTNYEETKAIYAKIAKWHAVSYKINLEEPEFFNNYHRNTFDEFNFGKLEISIDGITNFIEMLNDHEDLLQYKKFFEPLESTNLKRVENTLNEYLSNPNPLSYYVLCHGDFHHRNMLFKYFESTSSLESVLLIDYQMCYLGSIANDIIYSIYMLMDSEQRLKHLDELLYFYFSTFQETLKKIGFNGEMPKMIKFRDQLNIHSHYALFLLWTLLPVLYATYSNEHDFGELLNSKEKRKLVFKNPNYINEVRKLLPVYLHMGYLEN